MEVESRCAIDDHPLASLSALEMLTLALSNDRMRPVHCCTGMGTEIIADFVKQNLLESSLVRAPQGDDPAGFKKAVVYARLLMSYGDNPACNNASPLVWSIEAIREPPTFIFTFLCCSP